MDALRVTLLVALYFGNNSPGNSVSSNIDTGIPERSKVVLPFTSSKLTNPRILLLLSDSSPYVTVVLKSVFNLDTKLSIVNSSLRVENVDVAVPAVSVKVENISTLETDLGIVPVNL